MILRKIKLLITFYRSYCAASLAISAACLFLFREYGMHIFRVLFWFKLATYIPIYSYIVNYKINEFYYYQNLGMAKKLLFTATITIDFLIFLFLILLLYNYGQHP